MNIRQRLTTSGTTTREVWEGVRFLGVVTNKSVSDMWNYQEILAELKPSLIVEFGTRFGGSALYFSVIGRAINPDLRVLSVDVSHAEVYPQVLQENSITLLTSSSTDPRVAEIIRQMRGQSSDNAFLHPG